MKINKIALTMIFLVIASALVFAAGGRQQGGPTGTNQPDTNEASFMWWGDDARNVATIQAVEAFHRAFPGKTITAIPSPFDGYRDRILIQLASGTAPDLICFSAEWMGDVGFAPNPVLLDLREVDSIIDFSDFSPTLLAGGAINGRLLGVATGISGWSFNYNLNALTEFSRRSGRPLPPAPGQRWTMDEFIEYATVFKQTMGPDYAMLSQGFDGLGHILVSMLSEIAGTFYINERAELQVTEQHLVELFRLFARFTEAGVLPAPNHQVEALGESTIGTVNVAAGRWVGWFSWTSNIPQNGITSNSEVGLMAFPVLGREEFDGLFVRPAQFWSIAQASRNHITAAQLLNFILNDARAIVPLDVHRAIPPTERGQRILADHGLLSGPTYESTAYLARIAASPFHPFLLPRELMDIMRNEYSRFITGGTTAEATARTVYTGWQSALVGIRRANGL